MLFRHSIYYLLARGLPGLISFSSFAVYTRILDAGEYGRYAFVMAGVSLVQVIAFQWLQLVASRFASDPEQALQRGVMRHILALYLMVGGFAAFSGFALALLWPDSAVRPLIAVAVPLTLVQVWLQLNLLVAAVRLDLGRYARMTGCSSIIALLMGASLAYAGFGALALMTGLTVGAAFSWLLFGQAPWKGIRPNLPSRTDLREYFAYGLPLIAIFAMAWVISSSDRMLISIFLGEKANGVYAVGYDLSQQSLGLLLSIVNTAAYPLALRQMEENGPQAAGAQLARNGELIITLALVASAGYIALSPLLAKLFIGKEFQAGAVSVMPWIAAVAAVEGIKAFYLDIAFHLTKQSRMQVVTVFIGAVANLMLNLFLIPRHGILGAAWATLASISLAALASGFVGRSLLPMSPAFPFLFRGLLVALPVFAATRLVTGAVSGGVLPLALGGVTGAGTALALALVLDIAGLRSTLVARGLEKLFDSGQA